MWPFERTSDLRLPKQLQLLDAYRTTQHICVMCSRRYHILKVIWRFWTRCSMILNCCLSLFPTDWGIRLDIIFIFLHAIQPLDLGLTPRNEILRLQRVGYCSFYYFMSFCWTLVLLRDFLTWFLLFLWTYRMSV
jgi:hypothetical protein